ncbi:MAG: Ig-like domain-containing protein [Muribaculaceae bacterium]|nr:Ig-like domain-containing protein [Muribaculaceae bacterium]
MKKFLILISIVAASMFSTVSAAVGDQTTIVNQTLTGSPTLANTDAYSWGTDIKGMLTSTGLAMTNGNNKSGNFENRDFLTFANALGNATKDLNISYNLVHGQDKGQAKTYYTINYFNADGNFVFGIQEDSGSWGFDAYIMTANKEGDTTSTKLSNAHIGKFSKTTPVNISVKFSGEQAIIDIDGGSYTAYTSSEGIKDIKLSVTGGEDQTRYMSIENFIVKTTEVAAAQFADYTVKYVCGGKTIKEETKSGIVGSEISLIATETADFTVDGVKYIYVENDAEGQTVDAKGTTVVTITFREAAKYTYNVINNVNDNAVEGTCLEGNSVTVPYQRYILTEDGIVWKKESSGGDKKLQYDVTFSPNENNYTVNLDYAKYAENGIFYVEAEDIEGVTKVTNNNADTRCSDAAGAYTGAEAITVCTLEPGTYKIETAIMGGKQGDTDVVFTVFAGEEKVIEAITNGSWHTESGEIELTVQTDITVQGGSGNKPFDYILITGNEIPAANYTIKFVDEEGTEIKDAVTGSGFVGSSIEISEEDTKDFDKDGIPYIYDGIEPETPTIAEGGTTVTVKYHKQQDAKYTVNFVDQDGRTLKESVTRTGDAGSAATISDEDKEDIVVDDVTYVYTSDDTKDKTYAYDGSTEITITYNKVVDYSIKFVDESGEEIKATEIASGAIGSEITLPEEIKQFICVDGKMFLFVKDNLADNKTITDGGTTVTVTYRLPELGEELSIVAQSFKGTPTLENNGFYTWGENIKAVKQDSNGGKEVNGVYMNNNGSTLDFITFASPIGCDTQEINVSYDVLLPRGKGQANTYYNIDFYNGDNEFVFGIQEVSGDWKYISNIIYAQEGDAENKTEKLEVAHIGDQSGSTVNLSVRFSGNNALVSIDGTTYSAFTASKGIKYIKLSVSGGDGQNRDLIIESLNVKTAEVKPITTANYTVKYVCGELTLKEEKLTAEIGSEIPISESQMQPIFNEDKTAKYIYVTNDAEGKTVASDGSTEVTITFREAATYNYVVKNNINSDEVEGSVLEGESKTVPYNRYILSEGGKVSLHDPAPDKHNAPYTITVTPDKDGDETTIKYDDYAEDGIIYIEAEDIEGVTKVTTSPADARCSGAAGAYTGAEAITVCTLEPGTYKIETAIMGGKSGDTDVVFTVFAGEEKVIEAVTNGSWHTASGEIVLTEKTDITVQGGGGSKPFDYILITGKVFVPATNVVLKGTDNKTVSKLELVNGDEYQLTATVTPTNTTDEITWSSSNPEVATVVNGKVTAVGVGKVTITAKAGEKSATCEVKCYPQKGDAKWDGNITVADAVDITNYVVGKKTADEAWEDADEWLEFYTKGANVNEDKDGNITFADASAAVKLALDKPTDTPEQSRISAAYDDAADALVISGVSGRNIPVTLANSMEYVALQADIVLPEGMNVDVKAGERVADSNTMMTKRFADNHIRVAFFNLGNNVFADNNAPILEIVADSDILNSADIVIFNILASDSDATEYVLTSRISATSGVAAIGLDPNAPVKVFDLNGICVSDSMEGLGQGTYIVRQGNEAKKVRIR